MPAGRYRWFNGELYERMTVRWSDGLKKKAAEKVRNRYKKLGCKTRIVQDVLGDYYPYVRCVRGYKFG